MRASYIFDKGAVELARQWAVVDEATKAKYQAMAGEDKIRYQKELDDDKQENGGASIYSAHSDQKPVQFPVLPLPDFLW